jgi:cytochrome c oxidase subunit 1
MFILWLGFIQVAFLIAAGTVLIKRKLWSYPMAWAGYWIMVLAAVLTLIGVLLGANITYSGAIPLAEQYSAAWLLYLSFILLALGMLVVVVDFIMTVLGAVERKRSFNSWVVFFKEIPIASFAAIAGLFVAIPGLIAALKVFIPAFLWTLGIGSIDPDGYRLSWHIAFHIYHYMPALALVGVAYILVEATTDAKSVYAKQVAKALFLLYPFVVPPTFIYHLLVDPNIPEDVKFIGTILSLLVGMPTVLHMFIIVGMLEARMRQAGYGLFNWLKHLPWRNPAFGSMAMGMVTLLVGGLLAYVLIQGQLSPILHNTFVVPAYIHPMAAGGANLMFMGAMYYGVPVIMGRQLWGLGLARVQPYLMGGALLLMAVFGTGAGLAGVPRRYALLGADAPASWTTWMNLSLGVGGMLAFVAGIIFVLIMVMTVVSGKKAATIEQSIKGLEAPSLPRKVEYNRTPVALIPPIVFILGMIILTILAFNILWGVPILK